ncbi:MAG TPA: hypothetical protein VG537_08155 [Candidatus Kapabacteria bacterium]|jgi:hypothetical protein|nr:hypothetical protein [Candidatus Kapabacteria bacterium]
MRYFFAALLILTFTVAVHDTASAQFRNDPQASQPDINTADAMKGGDSFWSRLFDPSRFSMHQTYSMSFMSSGFGSTGLSMFTNTFSYKASDNLFVSADVSAVYSPFSTFGSAYTNSLNGIYLTNARLDWKLGDNTFMRIEYVGGPQNSMYGYNPYAYNPFYSPFASAPSVPNPAAYAGNPGPKLH